MCKCEYALTYQGCLVNRHHSIWWNEKGGKKHPLSISVREIKNKLLNRSDKVNTKCQTCLPSPEADGLDRSVPREQPQVPITETLPHCGLWFNCVDKINWKRKMRNTSRRFHLRGGQYRSSFHERRSRAYVIVQITWERRCVRVEEKNRVKKNMI